MEDLFGLLNIRDKEEKVYKLLLEEGALTANDISKKTNESRTNTYMILEQLVEMGMVIQNEEKAIRRFEASDPLALQKLLLNRQQEIKKTQALLKRNLPELKSLYNLGRLRPGVVHLEGLKGLEVMLNDMAKSQKEALLIPGTIPRNETWEVLKKGIEKRAKKGIRTKALFTRDSKPSLDEELHKKQKFEVRYWPGEEYPSEVVIYGNKCVFTSYEPEIVNTIITNEMIAKTMRGIFEQLWESAET